MFPPNNHSLKKISSETSKSENLTIPSSLSLDVGDGGRPSGFSVLLFSASSSFKTLSHISWFSLRCLVKMLTIFLVFCWPALFSLNLLSPDNHNNNEDDNDTVKPALVTTCLQRPPVYKDHLSTKATFGVSLENGFSLNHVLKEPVYKGHFLCFPWVAAIDRFDSRIDFKAHFL